MTRKCFLMKKKSITDFTHKNLQTMKPLGPINKNLAVEINGKVSQTMTDIRMRKEKALNASRQNLKFGRVIYACS